MTQKTVWYTGFKQTTTSLTLADVMASLLGSALHAFRPKGSLSPMPLENPCDANPSRCTDSQSHFSQYRPSAPMFVNWVWWTSTPFHLCVCRGREICVRDSYGWYCHEKRYKKNLSLEATTIGAMKQYFSKFLMKFNALLLLLALKK